MIQKIGKLNGKSDIYGEQVRMDSVDVPTNQSGLSGLRELLIASFVDKFDETGLDKVVHASMRNVVNAENDQSKQLAIWQLVFIGESRLSKQPALASRALECALLHSTDPEATQRSADALVKVAATQPRLVADAVRLGAERGKTPEIREASCRILFQAALSIRSETCNLNPTDNDGEQWIAIVAKYSNNESLKTQCRNIVSGNSGKCFETKSASMLHSLRIVDQQNSFTGEHNR